MSDEAVAGGVVDEMVSRTLSHHITTTPLEDGDEEEEEDHDNISHGIPSQQPFWTRKIAMMMAWRFRLISHMSTPSHHPFGERVPYNDEQRLYPFGGGWSDYDDPKRT